MVYEPTTRRVFTFNGCSHDASVIDAATGVLAHTLPLGGKLEFAAADGQGHLFVNSEDTSELIEIDAADPASRRAGHSRRAKRRPDWLWTSLESTSSSAAPTG